MRVNFRVAPFEILPEVSFSLNAVSCKAAAIFGHR